MIRDWLHRITCRYFGHQWGDWKYFTRIPYPFATEADVMDGWPMKSRTCKRCGEVDERDDMPEPVNCRCWIVPMDERTED
jgi:hypothetical protein